MHKNGRFNCSQCSHYEESPYEAASIRIFNFVWGMPAGTDVPQCPKFRYLPHRIPADTSSIIAASHEVTRLALAEAFRRSMMLRLDQAFLICSSCARAVLILKIRSSNAPVSRNSRMVAATASTGGTQCPSGLHIITIAVLALVEQNTAYLAHISQPKTFGYKVVLSHAPRPARPGEVGSNYPPSNTNHIN